MSILRNNLCIIPARGGSKRIPRKNVKDFLGKPIIAYSIEVALQSNLFEEVMVSTDDQEIADIALKYGAKVPFFRSEETANDFAPLRAVINEVTDNYKNANKTFDQVCCILPTAPFVNTQILTEAYELMIDKKFDSIRPIVRFGYPIQRAVRCNDGKIEMIQPEHLLTRSQDLEETFHDAGLFYWMHFSKGLEGDNKGGFVVSEKVVQDIDTLEDWEIAETKYKILNG